VVLGVVAVDCRLSTICHDSKIVSRIFLIFYWMYKKWAVWIVKDMWFFDWMAYSFCFVGRSPNAVDLRIKKTGLTPARF
jgi:hypothetical protein